MRAYRTPLGTCVKFTVGAIELSIATEIMSKEFQRSDIRIYKGQDDLTWEFDHLNLYDTSLENLIVIRDEILKKYPI